MHKLRERDRESLDVNSLLRLQRATASPHKKARPMVLAITSNIHPRPSGYVPAGEEGLFVEQLQATAKKLKRQVQGAGTRVCVSLLSVADPI